MYPLKGTFSYQEQPRFEITNQKTVRGTILFFLTQTRFFNLSNSVHALTAVGVALITGRKVTGLEVAYY